LKRPRLYPGNEVLLPDSNAPEKSVRNRVLLSFRSPVIHTCRLNRKNHGNQQTHKTCLGDPEFLQQKVLEEEQEGNLLLYLQNTQTGNALLLAFGLYPSEELKKGVLNDLVASLEKTNYRITMGVLDLYAVFDALCRNGFTDVAYKMVTQTSYPGWGYWMEHGATTCWEFWNSRGSLDHGFMGGKINAFFIEYLAGISPLKPGIREYELNPV